MTPATEMTVNRTPSSYTWFARQTKTPISTVANPPLAMNRGVDFATRPSLTDVDAASRDQGTSTESAQSGIEAQAAARTSVRGIVNDLDGRLARVTLIYSGRENPFLLEVSELEAAGADYPGALFEVVIGPVLEYKIVHLVAEEQAARKAAPPLDLSFLKR